MYGQKVQCLENINAHRNNDVMILFWTRITTTLESMSDSRA